MKKKDEKSRSRMKGTPARVLKLIKPYRAFVILSLLTAAVSVAGQLFIPILTGNAIDYMADQGRVDFASVTRIAVYIGIAMALSAAAQYVLGTVNNYVTFHVTCDLRNLAARKIERLPLSYLDTHLTGDLVSRVIADADLLSDGLLMGFTQLFTGVLTILGTLVFMLRVSLPIALVVILVTPLSLVAASYIANKTYRFFQLQSEVRGRETALVNESIEGMKVIHAFGGEQESLRVFDEVNEELEDASLKATFYSSLTNPATRFVNSVVYAGVILTGALFALSGGITVGQLSVFLTYANQYTKPFNEISGVVTELANALASAARIFELLDAEEDPADDLDARELHPEDIDGHVTLDHVDFSYVPDKPLIEDLTLDVLPGRRVAIVGPTGSGKTTLINLLMRFYDVDEGAILLGGTDIRKIRRQNLRAAYGMVLQETWLKAGTIAENIAYGDPGAVREKIVEAAKAARAHGFISRLPQGYDTPISEDGGQLSQGEKQLLCIARVMLSLPPMLILDEATSSIDTRTELKIQNAMARMMEGRTSFIVAHRLSTIREADVILVLADGHIVEKGTHGELLEKGGFYARLYHSQFEGVSI
ncbi:MAG: ABC transporter ATP-binding protein/permease [Lachnospiraceae bacterium]|nr:ABC transporter ATP-binding protein/permease [Lachnospiraceae bacterium]